MTVLPVPFWNLFQESAMPTWKPGTDLLMS